MLNLIKTKSIISIILFLLLYHSSEIIAQEMHHHHHDTTSNDKYHGMKMDLPFMLSMKEARKRSIDTDEAEFGSWNSVIPDKNGAAIGRILGMQTVHNVMLPSGKILMASGSSWRNYKDIEYYPNYEDPATAMGLFNLYDDPFRNSIQPETQKEWANFRKERYYDLVNNVAIYDPMDNSFYRIPHPVPVQDPKSEDHFVPSDLFCSAHLQLPDGNPLFIGGTQYYFPYRTGTNSTYIFDWKQELTIDWKSVDWRIMPEEEDAHYPWKFSGFMKRGRWYPSIVPLLDGRFSIFSGFVGFDKDYPKMYRFQINPYIEFFNPYEFSYKDPQKSWIAIDVKNKPNSPFTTKINDNFIPTPCVDVEFHDYWEALSCDNDFPLPCDCNADCMKDNEYDAFKLYPNNYLVEKDKVYMTREGDWVSLRTSDVAYMRRTKKTYFMNIEGSASEPDVSFSYGQDRKDEVTSYGTSYLDPNSKNITIYGGQPTSEGTLLPLDAVEPTQFAGGRGSRKREQFWFNEDIYKENHWTQDDDFLGTEIEDDRTMLTSIILPTKEVLIINGGNYDFYGPTFTPILLTPVYENGKFKSYTKKRMSAAVEPRLYHNAALLMDDGRVWVSGGNSGRASVQKLFPAPDDQNRKGQPKPNLDLVDIDNYFFRDGQMAKAQKGMQYTPTENWTAEIFSPPYMHIDSNRVMKITDMKRQKKATKNTFKSEYGDKSYYLLNGENTYSLILEGLPKNQGNKEHELVLIKLPSFTHNWNNGQFFVNLDIVSVNNNSLVFQTPNMLDELIPPGYYMMYYVDSYGKPSLSQMVRFDDKAVAP
jgi:hypothetical protein